MSIRPVNLLPDGSIEVWHDEAGHGGIVPAEQVQFGKRPDGTEDYRFITLPCPVAGCGSVSVHPVGGGADPERVQRLFVRAIRRHPKHPARTAAEATASAKQMAEELDGPGRWRVRPEDVEE